MNQIFISLSKYTKTQRKYERKQPISRSYYRQTTNQLFFTVFPLNMLTYLKKDTYQNIFSHEFCIFRYQNVILPIGVVLTPRPTWWTIFKIFYFWRESVVIGHNLLLFLLNWISEDGVVVSSDLGLPEPFSSCLVCKVDLSGWTALKKVDFMSNRLVPLITLDHHLDYCKFMRHSYV